MAILHLNDKNKCFGALTKKTFIFHLLEVHCFFAKMPVNQKMTIFICTIFLNGWEVKLFWGQSSQPLSLMDILCFIYIFHFILTNVPKRVKKNIRGKKDEERDGKSFCSQEKMQKMRASSREGGSPNIRSQHRTCLRIIQIKVSRRQPQKVRIRNGREIYKFTKVL